MIDIIELFYPGDSHKLIVSLCYISIFFVSYKRFDTLIKNFGTYDAPDTARPWTTWIRYHAAAAIYACLYASLFAVLYQLFHRHPILIKTVIDFLGPDTNIGKSLTDLSRNMELISPILALILLTLVVEKYPRVAAYDQRLRYYFQRLGSIPSAISLTIRKLKKYDLKVSSDACTRSLPDDIRDEVMLPMLQDDRKSLEHLYLRACHLSLQIEKWDSISSDYFHFKSAYYQPFENIRTRFEKINRKAERYYQLKLNFFAEAPLCGHMSMREARSGLEYMYPKVLTEVRKDLKHDLKNILENIYIFIACAVHSKGITSRKRKKLLKSFGFDITKENRLGKDGIDPNDLTILGMFLIFVIPLSAIFARFAGDEKIVTIHSTTYVVWSAMAIFIGIAAVAAVMFIKRVRESSENPFWASIQPYFGRPWFAYLISGGIAGVISIVIMFLLSLLTPENSGVTLPEKLARIVPWGLVPLNIAIVLGYHLDRKKPARKHTVAMEALTTGGCAMLGAAMALIINLGIVSLEDLIPRMYFSLTAAALLGVGVGAFYPQRFRRQSRRKKDFVLEKVDLKDIIIGCRDKYTERIEKEHVGIAMDVASDFPILNADPLQLKSAINGLISNALEFTPGKGEIRISATVHNGDGIRISVADQGIGMSNYKIKTILDDASEEIVRSAWEQVEEYADADLIQVRSIAEKHGGQLFIDSEQWVGTTVTIALPQKQVHLQSSQVGQEPPVRPATASVTN